MAAVQPGEVFAERYRAVAPIGRGGMGEVWRAEHLALRTEVAIKLLDPRLAERKDVAARFLREARAAASLRGDHIVDILDFGIDRDRPFMVMELLQGESLGSRLRRETRLAPLEIRRVFTAVGKAISRAHDAGIVHRDLKPDNIFLCREPGGAEQVKVLDFGIAKVERDDMDFSTETGAMLGTPHYMSPEQARGRKDLDARADLWSLAVIAFECTTGRRPIEAQALGELVLILCTEPMPVPSHVAPVPVGFDAWFERATRRSIDERFPTIEELVGALDVALEGPLTSRSSGEPTPRNASDLASAPTVLADESTVKPVKRRSAGGRWVVPATAVALAGTVAGVLWTQRRSPTRAGNEGAPVETTSARPAADSSARPLGAPVQITHEGKVLAATISRDGRRLAYVAPRRIGRDGIFDMALPAGDPRLLMEVRTGGAAMGFQPGTGALLFTAQTETDGFQTFRSEPDGTAPVVSAGWTNMLAWAPDGTRYAASSYPSASIGIHDASGRLTSKLALPVEAVRRIDWSHDGRAIAAETNTDKTARRGIWIASVGGATPPKQVVPAASGISSPRFAPGGDALLYARETGDGGRSHAVMRLDLGPDLSPLGDPREVVPPMDLAPTFELTDAGDLVFVRRARRGNLWQMALGGATAKAAEVVPTALTTGTWEHLSPAFSPDGASVAFGRRGPHGVRIMVMERRGGTAAGVTDEARERSSPVWSPDGASIAYLEREGDRAAIFITPKIGGTPRRVAAADWNAALAWAPADRIVALGFEAASALEIDPKSGHTKPLLPEAAGWTGSVLAAPDGKSAVFVWNLPGDDSASGIYRVAFGDPKPSPVHIDPAAIKGKGVTLVGFHGDDVAWLEGARLLTKPAGAKEPKTWRTLQLDPTQLRGATLRGDSLVGALGDDQSDVWEIKGVAPPR
ncbi:MAG: serine/threonine-protein kinase [Myxococcales bacterium]|nr:serine/threonine-protein kinase [Myxococcales bacterium]